MNSAPPNSQEIEGNLLVGVTPQHLEKCKITFNGSGNILFLEKENIKLRAGSKITFCGSNGLCYLSSSNKDYALDISIHNNCSFACGSDNYFNGVLRAVLSEGRSFLIGNSCLFSFGIWVRLADPHLIYDCASKERINYSKDVVIGDHVWIGQDAMLLKGSVIGSGSIIGAKSLISGKTVNSNSVWGGNPVKQIRNGTFWEESCVHTWDAEKTNKFRVMDTNRFIFSSDKSTLDAPKVMEHLKSLNTPEERLEFIKENLRSKKLNNRFYVEQQITTPIIRKKRRRLFKRKR